MCGKVASKKRRRSSALHSCSRNSCSASNVQRPPTAFWIARRAPSSLSVLEGGGERREHRTCQSGPPAPCLLRHRGEHGRRTCSRSHASTYHGGSSASGGSGGSRTDCARPAAALAAVASGSAVGKSGGSASSTSVSPSSTAGRGAGTGSTGGTGSFGSFGTGMVAAATTGTAGKCSTPRTVCSAAYVMTVSPFTRAISCAADAAAARGCASSGAPSSTSR